MKDFQISQLHAFAFSPHVDHYSVPAGSYDDQVPNHIAQSRLKNLLRAGESAFMKFAEENIGEAHEVLLEKISATTFSGWTKNYLGANERNFKTLDTEEKKRGNIIRGILLSAEVEKENEES